MCEAPSINREFARITNVAGKLEIAPGIDLARALWTHPDALRSRRVYGALRALAVRWPQGHAPQAFLALFAHSISGATVHVATGPAITLANRVQGPFAKGNKVDGPYLVLAVVGQYRQSRGFAPLRGYAQPILSGRSFVPINSLFERSTLHALFTVAQRLELTGIEICIEKPVFDLETGLGSCRPSFLIEARTRATGESRQIAIEACVSDAEAEARHLYRSRIQQLGTVIDIGPKDLAMGDLERLVWQALDL